MTSGNVGIRCEKEVHLLRRVLPAPEASLLSHSRTRYSNNPVFVIEVVRC